MKRGQLRDTALALMLVAATAGVGVAVPRLIPFFASAEQWLVDLRVTRLSEPEPQHDRIVIVAINEETLARLPYRSPIDRLFLAGLLQQIDAAEPAAIGIDILFDQPTEPEKDAALRQALDTLRAPAVLAWADEADGLTARQTEFLATFDQGLRLGWVTLLTDAYDGIPRWIYGGRRWHDQRIASFPAAVVSAALGIEAAGIGAAGEGGSEAIALAYRPPPALGQPAFRSFPAQAVAVLPAGWFRNKIVLVGADLPHIDVHRTPAAAVRGNKEGLLPGVQIHANAVAQLLDGREPAGIRLAVELPTVAAMSLTALLIGALNITPWLQICLGALFFSAFWLAGFALYPATGLLLPLISPSLAFALAAAGGNAFWRGHARRQSAFIQQAFSRFTSPAVVKELLGNPERLRLGGEKREISCLFTDVAGFTSWIEGSDPEVALTTLNGYLNEMCRIVFEHDGTINKIIGDALVVFFGAPAPQPDHPRRAVRCALSLDAFARQYARDRRASGIPFGDTRIGVHTGVAVVGNFGGDRFFDYTAYGDTVNTTARLESANKRLGTLVCVSEAAASHCPEIPFRPIGRVIVVGRSEPIAVLEPLTAGRNTPEQVAKYLEAFRRMQEHDANALQLFEELLKADPEDSLVRLHEQRLRNGESGTTLRLMDK